MPGAQIESSGNLIAKICGLPNLSSRTRPAAAAENHAGPCLSGLALGLCAAFFFNDPQQT